MYLLAAASSSTSWIDLHALWKICVVGLLAGAGLPALFALGIHLLSTPKAQAAAPGAPQESLLGGSPAAMAAAALCFLVFLAGIGWGVYSVVNG